MQSELPWIAVILPAIAGGILGTLREDQKPLRNVVAVGASVISAAIVLSLLPKVIAGGVVQTAPLYVTSYFSIGLRIDLLGMMFAVISSCLWVRRRSWAGGRGGSA